MSTMTLGSLFDGSGGFPLAGALNGIETKWIAEIEPYPCRVTAARFPGVPNHGDVTKISGAEIEPVDIITFGSPCQDLSVAGKQKGIHEGERSSLFFEAIRIIKEMRDRDRANGRADIDIRPRYAVWENVPGAFSSNGGQDFRAVLQAFCEIKGEDYAYVPFPEKGRWLRAGSIVGDGYSLAWRQLDAQYWGVPQRRKRIYLVADFGGERAGEILFERKSVRGDSAESGETGEGIAGDAEGSAGGSSTIAFGWANSIRQGISAGSISPTIKASPGGQNAIAVFNGGGGTLQAKNEGGFENISGRGIASTLDASYYKGAGARNGKEREIVAIDAVVYPGVGITSPKNGNNPKPGDPCMSLTTDSRNILVKDGQSKRKYIVRRLTPLECCRLQGFPDWWEDGVEGSDSARYKMWGNGVSLPTVDYVIGRIARREKDGADA